MGEYLPGNYKERLRELREAKDLSFTDVAKVMGVDRTAYSRLEKGETVKIKLENIIKLSKFYNVSADYILGISDVPEKTYYDIEELGLSVEAAKNLYSKKTDPRVVNELLLNDKFATATKMMATYFSNSIVKLLQTQNALLDFSYDLLTECTEKGSLPNDSEVSDTKKKLKALKLPANQVEMDKISRQMNAVIREIKKKIDVEISEASETTQKFGYEILESVKEEVLAHPEIKELSAEEKNEYIVSIIMKGIAVDDSLPEQKMIQLEESLKQLMPGLISLWK